MRLVSFAADVVRNRTGRRTLPRFLTYLVTFACNARCVMCDSWRKPSPDDLSLAELGSIFDQLPRFDAVRLSGGEPFVRGDLGEIAALAQSRLRPRVLHITTNGFLTDRIVAFCERRPREVPLRLLVSLDGLREHHNAIRGRATAFDGAVATLRALAPRREELGLHLSVNQTLVDAAGLADYRRLRDFLAPLGIRNQAVLAYDASATYHLRENLDLAPREAGHFPAFGRIGSGELAAFLDAAEEDAASLPPGERAARLYYLRGLRHRVIAGRASPNPPCVALNSHLRILPNGDVPTCQFNTRIVGNLRRQSFAEVWHGQPARQQRDWVRRCAGCWAECEILPSAIYTGDLLRAFAPRAAAAPGEPVLRRPRGTETPAPVPFPPRNPPIATADSSGRAACPEPELPPRRR